MKKIELPQVVRRGNLSLEQAIEQRRSLRRFSGESISQEDLSYILFYSNGVTDRRHGRRAAPSAGATYPIEVYTVVNNIDGLDRGIYHYSLPDHALELVREGDFRQEMVQASMGQKMMAQASVVLMMTAIIRRTERIYGERASRYVVLDAGHIAQNTYLMAASMGLGACAVGAFYDDDFNRLLGVNGKSESVLYMMAVGRV
ncbi:SagB/ThcOx family dehydrogenase [Chloroflexota bacterium]